MVFHFSTRYPPMWSVSSRSPSPRRLPSLTGVGLPVSTATPSTLVPLVEPRSSSMTCCATRLSRKCWRDTCSWLMTKVDSAGLRPTTAHQSARPERHAGDFEGNRQPDPFDKHVRSVAAQSGPGPQPQTARTAPGPRLPAMFCFSCSVVRRPFLFATNPAASNNASSNTPPMIEPYSKICRCRCAAVARIPSLLSLQYAASQRWASSCCRCSSACCSCRSCAARCLSASVCAGPPLVWPALARLLFSCCSTSSLPPAWASCAASQGLLCPAASCSLCRSCRAASCSCRACSSLPLRFFFQAQALGVRHRQGTG